MSYEYEVVNEAVSVKLCVYTTSMVIGVCPQRTGKKIFKKKKLIFVFGIKWSLESAIFRTSQVHVKYVEVVHWNSVTLNLESSNLSSNCLKLLSLSWACIQKYFVLIHWLICPYLVVWKYKHGHIDAWPLFSQILQCGGVDMNCRISGGFEVYALISLREMK